MSDGRGGVRDVDTEELQRGLADGSIVLVDVREPQEIAQGVIPGSLSMPLSQFSPETLPRARRVVFSCAAGVRSVHAIAMARAAGLDLHEHYRPGFKGWVAAGGEVADMPNA